MNPKKYWIAPMGAILIFSLVSCSAGTSEPMERPYLQQTKTGHNDISIHAQQLAAQDKRVDEAVAVAVKQDLSVALKVSNFNRLRLKSIRQDVHSKLSKAYPKHKVHVTTDSKLFSELHKLDTTIQKKHPKPQQLEKRLKKINEDMKG